MGDDGAIRAELARQVEAKIATDGVTLREVAAATGIDHNKLFRLLHGQARIDLATVTTLCRWMGVELGSLDPGRPERPSWPGIESDLRAIGLDEPDVAICRAVYIARQGR